MEMSGTPFQFLTDGGLEFQDEGMKRLPERFGIALRSTPSKSSWSNGKFEKRV